jgi:hypothetical protein
MFRYTHPLGRVVSLRSARQRTDLSGSALRAGTGPLRWVAEDATRPETGRNLPPPEAIHKPQKWIG